MFIVTTSYFVATFLAAAEKQAKKKTYRNRYCCQVFLQDQNTKY